MVTYQASLVEPNYPWWDQTSLIWPPKRKNEETITYRTQIRPSDHEIVATSG